MVSISIEGQTLELPPDIAVSDDAIRRAMAPIFPQIATATLSRTTNPADGSTVIKATKQAGTKGQYETILAKLKNSPQHINPIFPLYQRLYGNNGPFENAETFFLIQNDIEKALRNGEAEHQAIESIRQRLLDAPSHPSSTIPVAF